MFSFDVAIHDSCKGKTMHEYLLGTHIAHCALLLCSSSALLFSGRASPKTQGALFTLSLSLLLPLFPSLFLLLPLYSIGVPGGRGLEPPYPHAGSAPAPIKILKLPLSECLFCSVRLSLREPQTPPTPTETLAVSNGKHGPEFLGVWGEIYNRGPLIIIVVVIKINNNI